MLARGVTTLAIPIPKLENCAGIFSRGGLFGVTFNPEIPHRS